MLQFGGKPKKTSSDLKRHFRVVMGTKEHGLYVSSTPSSAARKAVTKLCTSNKSKKVEFCIREITQGSKKKTYGPYLGHIEKLKEPIELKGRLIKYKPVAKLNKKKSVMKGGIQILIEKNYERTDTDKMFENFLVKDQETPSQIHLKERMMKPDNLYFGVEHLIEHNGKKYYPYCLINITDAEVIDHSGELYINDLYLRILEKEDDPDDPNFTNNYAKTNKIVGTNRLIKNQEISNIHYLLLTINVSALLHYLFVFFTNFYRESNPGMELKSPDKNYEAFIRQLEENLHSDTFLQTHVKGKTDEELRYICNIYIMNNIDVKNLYLFYNIIQSINNYNLAGTKSKKIMVFKERMTKYLPYLKSFDVKIKKIIEDGYIKLRSIRNRKIE